MIVSNKNAPLYDERGVPISRMGQENRSFDVLYMSMGQKNLKQPTALAKATFAALEPFINIKCSGEWFTPYDGSDPHPIYMISQEQWAMLALWNQGQKPVYENGQPFYTWHVFSNFLTPKHIDEMIARRTKHYFTGGRDGKTLVMIDVDAHEDWQTDVAGTTNRIIDFLGPQNCFVVNSTRGTNVFLKISYGSLGWEDMNKVLHDLGKVLNAFTQDCLCTVEVKGTITTSRDHYGTLAKLPCYGDWSYERLRAFEALPVKPVTWLVEAGKFMLEKAPPAAPRPTHTPPTKKVGSTTGLPLTQEQLERIPDLVKSVRDRAYYCFSKRHEPAKKGVRLTWLDFAYAFIVLSICGHNPNEDDQLPQNRIMALWDMLYQQGHFTRAFDNSRWKAIRNTLIDCGFTEMIDNTYWFDPTGKTKGKAMQWALQQEYILSFDGQEEGEGIYAGGYPEYVRRRWRPRLVLPATPVINEHLWWFEREEELDDALCVA